MRVVFFSFHYSHDIWREYVVRNSWYYKESIEAAGFWDGSIRENYKTYNESELSDLIKKGLYGTSVTVVLICRYTSYWKWVKYEIKQSIKKGNGLLGIYIHNIKNKYGKTDRKGNNPFDYVYKDGRKLSYLYPIYDWVYDKGKLNLGDWIEEAYDER